ncbi:MAG TPA: hypothetical protein PKI32_06260, partial [Opitutales bacterium]|nr:hypothetical protein [Opitutales bacterium]
MNITCMLIAATVVANGDFEQDNQSWNLGRKTCQVVAGAGLGGSKGLVWQTDDPAVYSFTTQRLNLEPGCAYVFSGWVKDEGVTNVTHCGRLTNISTELHDANGTFIRMIGSSEVVDNQVQEAGWVQYEGRTPVLPSDIGHVTLVCSAVRGSAGKATFDNIEVKQLAAEPIPNLVSSAYRDIAASGTVSFVARCLLKPHRDPIDSVTARFRCVGLDGELVLPSKVADGIARAEADVASLAWGTHPVQIELKRRDGTVLATRELLFTRVETLPTRKVGIDEYGRTLVDGK